MKKILFIQPYKTFPKKYKDLSLDNLQKISRIAPSIPAMVILGQLKNDYEIHFIDASADGKDIFQINSNIYSFGLNYKELLNEIKKINPDIILITSMFSTEYFVVNQMTKLIKRKFSIPIILGGLNVTLRPEWYNQLYIDSMVIGEGEKIIKKVVNDALSNNLKRLYYSNKLISLNLKWEIKEILIKRNGSNRYPIKKVSRTDYYIPLNIESNESIGVIYPSRGCPFQCKFCCAGKKDGLYIRHMSLKEMINLTKKFIKLNIKVIHIHSDTFGLHPIDIEYLKWVSKKRKSTNINFINSNAFFLKYFFPNNKFCKERVDLLEKAGFEVITIAIDSFNNKYNKKINSEFFDYFHIKELLKYIKQKNIKTDLYMIYGFPNQTKEELKEDINILNKLRPLFTTVTWRFLTYFPGTFYYDWAIKEKKFKEEQYKQKILKGISFYNPNRFFNFSNMTLQEMKNLLKDFVY